LIIGLSPLGVRVVPSTLRRALGVIGGKARLAAVASAALAALLAGMLAPARPALAVGFTTITGSGSSWQYPAMATWISDVAPQGMTVNYNPDGSASGRNEFKQGIDDWAASDIPYGVMDGTSFDAPPARGYAYMPDLAGGVAFTYHLSIDGHLVTNLRLSGAVIAGIFTNQITTWNDPRIAADNPGLTLPATLVTPVVRSDSSGTTAQFTQWMLATQTPSWAAYCQAVGRSPCTATSIYPVQPGTAMVGQPRDGGAAAYLANPAADGAIAYTEYSYTLNMHFPVAKVLNAAGYYTAPTAGNVAVSLLSARINTDPNDPLYLTADLSPVYTDPDPHLRAVLLLVHDLADRPMAGGFIQPRQGLYPGHLRQVRALPGPGAGGPAGLLGIADQPGRGGLRAAGADPGGGPARDDQPVHRGLQQPHVF
jgi:ABC-type phosphate transport system substrate-binding protein